MKAFKCLNAACAVVFFLLVLPACTEQKTLKKISNPIDLEQANQPQINLDEEEIQLPEPEDFPDPVVEKNEPPQLKLDTSSRMERLLVNRCHYVTGRGLTTAGVKQNPTYFILYLTAEWSAPCKKNIKALKKVYQEEIALLPEIELLMLSIDTDSSWMKRWAVEADFDWPIVMRENKRKIAPLRHLEETTVPLFILFNTEGKEIDVDSYTLQSCLTKAKSLLKTNKT